MLNGILAGILTVFIVFVIVIALVCLIKDDVAPHPLTTEDAIRYLQQIKAYYTYKGGTWTALDMAIKALQEKEEREEAEECSE